MARNKLRNKSPLMETALGFALGAVGGCILGTTEDPVDRILSAMTSSGPLKPVMEEVRVMGPLGLGTLMGATALTALAPVLSDGEMAGALLGVLGAAGVSVGATWAAATRWSSRLGTVGTVAGLILGALGMGKLHIVNIGLQLPVAFVFAMSNPF